MAAALGPMKAAPAFSTASEKWAFSERKPYESADLTPPTQTASVAIATCGARLSAGASRGVGGRRAVRGGAPSTRRRWSLSTASPRAWTSTPWHCIHKGGQQSLANEQGSSRVGLRVDGHGLDAEAVRGAHDAACDLAAVGDQDLAKERPRRHCRAINATPAAHR
eukprot:scaffold6589_cov116-Isochrysis_galbana.AAC.7